MFHMVGGELYLLVYLLGIHLIFGFSVQSGQLPVALENDSRKNSLDEKLTYS